MKIPHLPPGLKRRFWVLFGLIMLPTICILIFPFVLAKHMLEEGWEFTRDLYDDVKENMIDLRNKL